MDNNNSARVFHNMMDMGNIMNLCSQFITIITSWFDLPGDLNEKYIVILHHNITFHSNSMIFH